MASLPSICPLSAITGLDWYDCCYKAADGAQSFGASSKPLKSNPGATVQLTSVHSPRLCAACQACAGTIACGRSPATRSAPSVRHATGPFASAAISSLRRARVVEASRDRIDLVPVRALAAREQKQRHRGRRASAVHLTGIAERFAKMSAFGMRLEVEQADQLGGGGHRGSLIEHAQIIFWN